MAAGVTKAAGGCVPPQGLLGTSARPHGLRPTEALGWTRSSPNPELFLLKGNTAAREGTKEAAREPPTKEQNRPPLVVLIAPKNKTRPQFSGEQVASQRRHKTRALGPISGSLAVSMQPLQGACSLCQQDSAIARSRQTLGSVCTARLAGGRQTGPRCAGEAEQGAAQSITSG